jgi:hypothetical protein
MENKIMDTCVDLTQLEPGSSYWIGFRNERKLCVRAAMTVVRIGDTLMGESFDGQSVFNLPKNITSVQKMGPFQVLRWKANGYQRNGDTEMYRSLMAQAYRSMPDQWYLDRVEKLTAINDRYSRGAQRERHLDEVVDQLRHYRPDLDIESLTYVKRQAFDLDALLTQLTSPSEDEAAEQPSPSTRVKNWFRSLVRR